MKLLLVCLDGLRLDLALPEVVHADERFAAPDHPSDPRFSVGAPDHTFDLAEATAHGVLAPTLTRLAAGGVVLPVWMTPPTDSGPGWASLLTGSTHEECNVWWNEFVGHQLARRPDLLSRLWFANPDARTLVASDWEAISSPHGPGPIVQQRVDQQRTGQHRVVEVALADARLADREVTQRATWVLNHEGPDASIVYLVNTDSVAHEHGPESEQYRAAIRASDEHLRHLVKAVAERHEALGEDWLVAVTTDHGHRPGGGHGDDEVEVRRSFLLLHRIGGDLAGDWSRRTLRAEQVTPLLLELLGVHEGRWAPDHPVGEVRDLPPAGPTRDPRFEW